MKIAIMGAMPEEIQPLISKMNRVQVTEYGNNKYYEGSYGKHDLVVAYSKIGKVFASLTATTLIEKFGCEKLLFSGVAGAINPKLKIGDLIAATSLCQHDVDITAFGHPAGFIPESKTMVGTDKDLLDMAFSVAKSNGLHLSKGVIATGDQFVASTERKEWIESTFNADALEMEGASVAVVCDALDIPFFILRAISDSADMDASFNFDEFVVSSAEVSAKFILNMVNAIE